MADAGTFHGYHILSIIWCRRVTAVPGTAHEGGGRLSCCSENPSRLPRPQPRHKNSIPANVGGTLLQTSTDPLEIASVSCPAETL